VDASDKPEPQSPAAGRWTAVLLLLVALLASGIGVHHLIASPCLRCNGLLALILPWVGAAFYLALGVVAWRKPASAWLSNGLAFAVFAHACLVTEALLLGRLCPSCFAVAGLVAAAAIRHAWRNRPERVTLAAALLLGAASAWSSPSDRVEATLTRRIWPSRILADVPPFVPRTDFSACGHRFGLQIHLYEDQRSCGTCSSLRQRLLPALARDFREQLCTHEHVVPAPPTGQGLPMLVLIARSGSLVAIEGRPDEDELRELVKSLLAQQTSERR
jgi:hypothetical protein